MSRAPLIVPQQSRAPLKLIQLISSSATLPEYKMFDIRRQISRAPLILLGISQNTPQKITFLETTLEKWDQVGFVGLQLVIRSFSYVFIIRYIITAVNQRNQLDPNNEFFSSENSKYNYLILENQRS